MVSLKLDVVRFNNEDVIATSGVLNGLFYIPFSQYTGSYTNNGGTDYIEFGGDFNPVGGGNYQISNIHNVKSVAADDYDALHQTGDFYFMMQGVTVFMDDLRNVAKQGYDAFTYGDGKYYTNGVSYYESYWQ